MPGRRKAQQMRPLEIILLLLSRKLGKRVTEKRGERRSTVKP